MTRRRRAARRRKGPPTPLSRVWTIRRATGIGIIAAAAMLLLWIGFGYWPRALHLPFLAASAVTGFCGVSILWITAFDLARRGRGHRMVPIRAFDVALGILFAVPGVYAVRMLLPEVLGL